MIGDALCIARKGRVKAKRRVAQCIAKAAPLRRIQQRDADEPVFRLEHLSRTDHCIAIAGARGHNAAGQVVGRRVGQQA